MMMQLTGWLVSWLIVVKIMQVVPWIRTRAIIQIISCNSHRISLHCISAHKSLWLRCLINVHGRTTLDSYLLIGPHCVVHVVIIIIAFKLCCGSAFNSTKTWNINFVSSNLFSFLYFCKDPLSVLQSGRVYFLYLQSNHISQSFIQLAIHPSNQPTFTGAVDGCGNNNNSGWMEGGSFSFYGLLSNS